jgi:hypothetical protein
MGAKRQTTMPQALSAAVAAAQPISTTDSVVACERKIGVIRLLEALLDDQLTCMPEQQLQAALLYWHPAQPTPTRSA